MHNFGLCYSNTTFRVCHRFVIELFSLKWLLVLQTNVPTWKCLNSMGTPLEECSEGLEEWEGEELQFIITLKQLHNDTSNCHEAFGG